MFNQLLFGIHIHSKENAIRVRPFSCSVSCSISGVLGIIKSGSRTTSHCRYKSIPVSNPYGAVFGGNFPVQEKKPLHWLPGYTKNVDLEQNRQLQSCKTNQQAVQVRI
ncbi:uncharacterized protein LOC111697576 [Eurytemora carolleeae]|uniref:uncharacterized protein LOC111697576 n=1 Tax=Eurytemora carolleeae TaxID=1294199 RepID=UPI000C7932EB|nr:uncharacterized protein LOC111697576 [Eurytemora carolleeae]|eukprot:XP_023323394.1 uncharacterized protein LOC111697576 [Eurytemora affinis]